MSHSQLTKLADRELRDLSAKLRFALVSVLFLPPLGATLTTLGVPRPIAAVVVFAGLSLLLLAFVVARASESTNVTPEEYEYRMITEILVKLSPATAVRLSIPAWEKLILRLTSRLASVLRQPGSN